MSDGQQDYPCRGRSLLISVGETPVKQPMFCVGCFLADLCQARCVLDNRYEIDIRIETLVVAHRMLCLCCPYGRVIKYQVLCQIMPV